MIVTCYTKSYNCPIIIAYILISLCVHCLTTAKKRLGCWDALGCGHSGVRLCGLQRSNREVRWFLDKCDLMEFNCEYKASFEIVPKIKCKHVPQIKIKLTKTDKFA